MGEGSSVATSTERADLKLGKWLTASALAYIFRWDRRPASEPLDEKPQGCWWAQAVSTL